MLQTLNVNPRVLKDRLQELGLTVMDVARIVADRRNAREGVQDWTGRRIYSTIQQAINKPDPTSMRILEEIVEALDGELVLRWRVRQQVVSGERFVNLDGETIAEE